MARRRNRGGIAKRLGAAALTALSVLVVSAVMAGASSAATTPNCSATDRGNLCVLDPTASGALTVEGGSSLSVAGDVVVDSSAGTAASTSGGSTVVANAIGGPGGFSGSFTPAPVNVPAQPDPFNGSSVAHGSCSSSGNSLNVTSGTQSAVAGIYDTIDVSGGTLNLGPGVYTITAGFTNSGSGAINGTGVTIYLCPGATFDLSGSSSTTLSSPSGSVGFVIFSDSAGSFHTVGVTTNLVGRVYARLATLTLQNFNVQGDVVARTVDVHSLGVVNITGSQTPTIATLLSASSITVGGSVNDTATLSGATANAGGTVTYSVYTDNACSAGKRDAGTVTVTNGAVPASNSLAFNTAGDFYWQAVYSGDQNNIGASSACTSEHLVVNKATPALTTNAFGPVTVGAAIHDTAHLSGGVSPTGTITFDVYDSSCTTKLTTVAATTAVTGAGDYVSANYTPAAAGTYKWVAHYSGDANNNKVDTTCGAEGETSTVNATGPSIATTLSASTVTTGDSVHDSAKLTGVTANAGGTVTYSVYDNNTCTTNANKRAAGTVTVTNGVVPDSNALVFSTAGDFYWQAAYSGDANNGATTSPCTSEHLVVNAPVTPPSGGGGGGGGTTVTTVTPPVTPTVDLAILKTASPTNLLVGKDVTYTLTVTNNGPVTDTNVQVSDSLPAGVSFVNISTSQGTCTGGNLVQCQIGTMTNGQVVTIKIGVTTTATGTIVNTGTVTGALPETTLANNQSSATIQVTAPAKPKPKPKPFTPPSVKKQVKAVPPPCYTVTVAPKNLTVGKAGTLQLSVTGKSKPISGVKVSVRGAGAVLLSGPTNSAGKVTLILQPQKPGIVSLRAASHKSCNTARVGVVSAFTPPVTG